MADINKWYTVVTFYDVQQSYVYWGGGDASKGKLHGEYSCLVMWYFFFPDPGLTIEVSNITIKQ